jgi:hypothetical protein
MALGYGYPLLLFNPPASPMLTTFFRRLSLDWTAAVNATFVVGVLLSGLTTWLLVREWWGDVVGVLAGVIVITLPFHSYVNFHRASTSEALAWALPPLVLWGLIRWQQRGQRVGLLAAAGGLAALLLTHDASAYLFLPLPIATMGALAAANRSPRMLWRGIAALALGVGLAAFFWLPSVTERGFVQFQRVLAYPYAASFLALDYLLEAPRAVDPTWLNPWLPKGIGLLPALAVLAAPLGWLRASREQRFWLAAVAAVTVGYVTMSLPYAAPIWRLVPVLQYLHFPWRFLTPAAVGIGVLGSVGLSTLERRSPAILPVLAGILVIGSLGWFYPPHCDPAQPATLSGMLAYEESTGEMGGTVFSELLPAAVHAMPSADGLRDDIAAGREPRRLRPESLPDGARIVSAQYGPLEATIELESPTDFRARYLALYYPGWHVTIDGTPARIVPTEPEGLVSFHVPAGHSTIRLWFAETPARRAADVLSIVSLIALVVLMVRPSGTSPEGGQKAPRPRVRGLWILLAVSVLVVFAKLAVIDRLETPLRRSRLINGRLENVDVATDVTFGDEFVLLGHDTLPASVASGERIEVTTYWRALEPGGPDYGVTVSLVDPEGIRWNDSDIRPPRWHRVPPPTGQWPPDQYAVVALSVPLRPGTPPGEYHVELVAFDRKSLSPLTAHDGAGTALGPSLDLGPVSVTAPRRPPDLDSFGIAERQDIPIGPLTLLGAHFDRAEAAPGDPVLLTSVWEATEQPDADLSLSLTLVAPDGSVAATYDLPLTVAWHPTSRWKQGDIWTGQHPLRLPAHLESGSHSWSLRVCQDDGGKCKRLEPEVRLDSLAVQAPTRVWTPPPVDVRIDTQLGGKVTLVGANLQPGTRSLSPGDRVTVTLVWRADSVMEESYNVYLHLLGPDGDLVAQLDGEPANWTRPTTGWAEGEIVLDPRVLALPKSAPPGEYHLRAGMYTIELGRLATPDGDDGVTIAILTLDDEPQ